MISDVESGELCMTCSTEREGKARGYPENCNTCRHATTTALAARRITYKEHKSKANKTQLNYSYQYKVNF